MGTHRAGTNVTDLAALNNIVEGLHNLLGGHVTIHPVDLEHVNVSAETLNTTVHGLEDMLPREADLVHAGPIVTGQVGWVDGSLVLVDELETFGHDDELGAGDVILLDGGADDFLGAAVGVGVGHVPGVDAAVKGVLEDGEGLVLVEEPGLPVLVAEAHAAEDDLGDLEAGFAHAVEEMSDGLLMVVGSIKRTYRTYFMDSIVKKSRILMCTVI